MAQVILEQVCKSYDQTAIIRDVSLTVADREFLVLVGPSGCGKSTLLRMIAGLETVTAGTLRIGDCVVNDVPPKDRDIAMVFQNYALYPHMSVYDNMAFGLKMRKFPKAEIQRRVQEAATILELEALLDRKPKQLSGGQRQRVALGRAIVRDPKVFLMDEPLSNLDAKLRVQMRAEITRLHRRLNATTIYVTHDQTEAMTMGDRIVVLNQGVIQQADTPLAIYHQPANRFVAGFIGQMSFVPGIVTGGMWRCSEGLELPVANRGASSVTGEALLGLRPEHFGPADDGLPGLTVCPLLVETLGAEKMLHFTLADHPVVARVPSDMPVGETVRLSVDVAHGLLFHPDTGQRMGVATPTSAALVESGDF